MRIVFWLLGGVVALLVLAGVVLALVLPRLIDTPEVREAITSTAREQLGREVRYEALGVGLLPPSLVVWEPYVAGPTEADAPLLGADSISLRVGLWPLLRGVVRVDSLVLERAVIELIRTSDGLLLPGPPPAPPDGVAGLRESPLPASSASELEPSESPVAVAIRSVWLRDSEVVLVDRTHEPPVTWAVDGISGRARGSAPDAPIELALDAALRSGGTIALAGSLTLQGDADLELLLKEVALAQAAPYAGAAARLDAGLSGELELKARASALEKARVRLRLDAEDVAIDALGLSGTLLLESDVVGEAAGPTGSFRVDAGQADIRYAEAFGKPTGETLVTEGRFRTNADGGLDVDVSRLQLSNLESTASLRSAEAITATLAAPAFDLEGWGALLPALAPYDIGGAIELKDLSLQAEPLVFGGEIVLDDVRLDLPDAGALAVDGRVVGWGDGFHLVDFDLGAADQHIALSGKLLRLSGDPIFEASVTSVGVLRANALMSELTSLKDTLYGPLELSLSLSGRAGESAEGPSMLESLRGKLRFRIGEGVGGGTEGGRLAGVSMLRSVYTAFESAQRLAELAGAKPVDVERYFGDEFEHMEGRFDVEAGYLETRSLRIVYREYGVNLRGRIALADQSLDMTGEVELGSDFVALLGSRAADREIVVPLAHVGGTPLQPEVSISPAAAKALSRQLLARNETLNESVDKVSEELDRYIPNLSDALKKDLGGLLDGGR